MSDTDAPDLSGVLLPLQDGLFGHTQQTWIAATQQHQQRLCAPTAARARPALTSAAKDQDHE